ncbi:MAG: protein kinase, partial [Gemmatimonadota bacterium]|nr:protein kinase [Gemmatimonadota bacterium]
WLEDGHIAGSFAELQARLAHTLDGRYKVRDVLGAGGMGVVFLADDLALDRAVAVKVLPPEVSGDATVVSRFRREAKTAARLDHPGIIPIYRVENEGGLDYFIMKYVAGRSLEAVLRDESPLSIPFATRILREASAALAHAHRHGVVHRDVKPANIMLDADERVILTDFGISHASSGAAADATTEPRLTEVGTAIGTPQYMAPEQAVGHAVDGRADQYALAIVGFEMVAGRVPFDDETPHAIVHRQISEAPPELASLRPDVPRHLAAVIAKGLRKSPSSRFATMEEFALALDDASMATLSPTTTRTIGAGQATPTRVKPMSNDRELDTALDRVFDTGSHRAPRSTRSVAMWMTMAVLVLAGLGAAAWARGGLSGPRRAAERPTRVTANPARVTAKPAAVVPQGRPKETRRRSITLGVTSTPRATVFIDGARVGETPITGRALTVGRSYQIRVERKGYRTKRETITAAGTRPLRRSYVLQKESRR